MSSKHEHGIHHAAHRRDPYVVHGNKCKDLLSRQGNVLEIKGIDVLDGTPLLDIKPYVKEGHS